MKKFLSIYAPTAAIILCEGIVFKLMHFPGAGVLTLIGAMLVLVAIILGMVYKLRQPNLPFTKWFVGISLVILCIALTFKFMHFSGGTLLCLLAFGIFCPGIAVALGAAFARSEDEE